MFIVPRSVELILGLFALSALLGSATTAAAQRAEGYGGNSAAQSRQARSGVPGEFDYYTLVLSWSPTYCASRTSTNRPDPQCELNAKGRPYAFVLHGLWPQYNRGFPDRCWTAEKPFVPKATIERMLDIMPSRGLVIHEYRKHGTCSGLSPDDYYALSRRLYEKIKVPKRFVQPVEAQTVGVDQVVDEFVAENPGLRPDMLAVSCGGAGNRLREVRICFSRTGDVQPCGANENQRRMCQATRMFVPPVRVSASPSPGSDWLPGPK
ncbi:MAG: ribonuclease T [Hyphomicrobiaceae bacterium]|nr:ribonuclease T [Hyphomicrobiaceae bacterium]